jgi:hypothetical protein
MRKVLRPAIPTQVFFISRCLQANAEMVPKYQAVTAYFSCSPPDLNQSKLSCTADKATKSSFPIMQLSINQKKQHFVGLVCND